MKLPSLGSVTCFGNKSELIVSIQTLKHNKRCYNDKKNQVINTIHVRLNKKNTHTQKQVMISYEDINGRSWFRSSRNNFILFR